MIASPGSALCIPLVVAVALVSLGCGGDRALTPAEASTTTTTSSPAPDESSVDADSGGPNPGTSTDGGDTTSAAPSDTSSTGADGQSVPCPNGGLTIYLNRDGGRWGEGTADSVANTSELPIGDPLGPHMADDAAWSETVDCVVGLFEGLDVVVTDVDPGAVDHIEVAITDDPSDDHGIGGAFSIGLPTCELQRRGVGFVFVGSGDDPSPQHICTAGIGFVVGLAAGLERSIGPCEVMSMLECGNEDERRFIDEEYFCGWDMQKPCFCGGALQNSWQTLRENVGLCGG